MKIWQKQFETTYVRDDGVIILNDTDIPLPEGFLSDMKERSTVVLPPHSRAGDHYHEKRQEVYVGFGVGLELVVEDPDSKEVKMFKMDPTFYDGNCVSFWMKPYVPHAV